MKKNKYITLILAIIGYFLAMVCVVIFLNINSNKERFLWAILWLICCNLSNNLFKQFKRMK